MSPQEMYKIVDSTFTEIQRLNSVKSGEYANDTDKLANFKDASMRLGLIPEQVLLTYLDKHYSSICNFVKDLAASRTRTRSEPIQGRVDDMILYLMLFKALLAERHDLSTAVADEPNSQLEWDDEE